MEHYDYEQELNREETEEESEEESWETMPRRQQEKNPLGKKAASVAILIYGAFNVFTGVAAILTGVRAGGGMYGLMIMLLPIGALQIVSGVMLWRLAKAQTAALVVRCKTLGLVMLLATVAYIIPNFLLRGFVWGTVTGPILSIMYLAAQSK